MLLSVLVPFLWWAAGLVVTILFTVIVLYFSWGINPLETLISVLLGFLFAFVAIQSAGESNINPVGSIAKTSQIILAALPPHNVTGDQLTTKQTINLAAGLVSAASAHQSTDMVGDLKTGHLVGASPRAQFLAQLAGSVFSIFTGFSFWLLFASAYPCIIDDQISQCEFSLQAVTAWQAVAQALTTSNTVPQSAIICALVVSVFVVLFVITTENFIPKDYHGYVLNWNLVGVALINTDQGIILALFLGALASYLWKRSHPDNHKMYLYSVASGFIAGEG